MCEVFWLPACAGKIPFRCASCMLKSEELKDPPPRNKNIPIHSTQTAHLTAMQLEILCYCIKGLSTFKLPEINYCHTVWKPFSSGSLRVDLIWEIL